MCEKYNGWSNYPTWCVKLWIDNDEGLQNVIRDKAQVIWMDREPCGNVDARQMAITSLADELDDFIGEMLSDNLPYALGLDLYNWAFGQVNWWEIAKAIIEDEIEED